MSFVENLGQRLLISQAYILVYSALAAFMGISARTFLVILVLIIVTTYLQNRFLGKGPLGQGRVRVEDVMEGRKVFEEKRAREIQMEDEDLVLDLQRQSRFSLYMTSSMFVGLAYFLLAWGYIDDIYGWVLANVTSNQVLAHFIAFLAFFEVYFLISQSSLALVLRRAGKMPVLSMPGEYTVTTKGIVYKGLITSTAIRFPLPGDVRLLQNDKRRFVELRRDGKRSVTIIRLYTKKSKRLYEVIQRYGYG